MEEMVKLFANIERADNGYIVDLGDCKTVFTDTKYSESFINMFNFLMDYFEEYKSKHEKIRPYICYRVGSATMQEVEELKKELLRDIIE